MPSYPKTLKRQAEKALNDPLFDFIATYHAVADLRKLVKNHPDVLDEKTIHALDRLFRSDAYQTVRQAYFLYREAAKAMTDMVISPNCNGLGTKAMSYLQNLLVTTGGSAHKGIAEALGGLPVHIDVPQIGKDRALPPPALSWRHLLQIHGVTIVGAPWFIGRSLVAKTTVNKRLLVVKLGKSEDTIDGLAKEIQWMETLKQPTYAVSCRFHIPHPLNYAENRVFRIHSLPTQTPVGFQRHAEGLAIAFLARPDYFTYPNQHGINADSAQEALERNAFLLGKLASKGVIHDAPIPLFHNRTQRLRRGDQGRYQWFRAGRLDQWLDSCQFPNLGLSGLRDFEHLEPFTGHGRILYRHIGSHFFSLLLVAGSHFRCREMDRVGLDENGKPVDARDLFDPVELKGMIRSIFSGYYTGFTGTTTVPNLPTDEDRLTKRMIEEMGIDRYMTELLRRTDQNALTDNEFASFLLTKGYDKCKIQKLNRGEKDILISSGPHLGDFNRQISLPELTEGVAAMAAVCVAGRYARERKHPFP